MRKNRFRGKSFLIQSRRERDTYRVDVAVSVLFRTLWSLHDIVHVRNPHFIRRVWRQNSEEEGVIFLLTCTSKKIQLQKEISFGGLFFFRKKTLSLKRETNRIESKLFLFKNLILLNLPSLTKRSLGRGRWRRCARTNGKRGRCRIRCRRKGKRSRRRRRRRWWLRSRWLFAHQRRCRWSW